MHQTRRLTDFVDEESTRPCPAFIILGAQKAGTTSLYELLCQHPLVIKGKVRETHYFDWLWNRNFTSGMDHYKYYMNFFNNDVLKYYPTLVTGESSPSYLLNSGLIIPRIKLICPDSKFLVLLRNPTLRAFSHYQMGIDKSGTEVGYYATMSFEEAIDKEIEELASIGIKVCERM